MIDRFVDFDALRAYAGPPLFVSATNVHTGRLRVFPRDKITADVVMASACLPTLFHAVEIDGVPYWDGGYRGNPAIFPFFDSTETEDVLLVQINPIERRTTPRSQTEIIEPHQRNHVQLIAAVGISRDRFRGPADRSGPRCRAAWDPGEYRRINVHRVSLDSDVQDADRGFQDRFGLRLL